MNLRTSAIAAGLLASVGIAGSAQAASSVWEEINSSKTLKACVTQYSPNSFKDLSGNWKGFVPAMAADLAKTMGVKLELVETTWKTVVLDVQSSRCHVILGLTATPERALAMDFAGPIYSTIFSYAPRRGLANPPKTWEELSKPENKVSVLMGTSQEQVLMRYAPKASRTSLQSVEDAVLAVQSNRVDFYMGAFFDILAAKAKGPALGEIVVPTPQYATPSYAGVRYDSDGRFVKFLQRWAENARFMGKTKGWIVDAVVAAGAKESDIPAGIEF